jgi:hypothetical protein
MFTRSELKELRASISSSPEFLVSRPDVVEALLTQAEYALDCAALLDEAVHHPAEPYSDTEALVARLTDGVNDIWNRHR